MSFTTAHGFRNTVRDDGAERAAGPAEAPGRPAAAETVPYDVGRSGAIRGLVRPPYAGDAVLGDARPDGDHRPAGGHLPRRRPAGHLDVPLRQLRGPDDPDRPRVLGRGTPVRANRGIRGDQG